MTDLDDVRTADDGADLRDLMTRSVSDLHPPVERLQAGALVRGQQIRKRRQGLAALSGLAAAVTVAALVVPAVSGSDPRRDAPGFADDPSPTQPNALTSASVEPGPDHEHGYWDMPADEMLDRLEPLLPDGVTITGSVLTIPDRAPGEPSPSHGWLHVQLTREGVAGTGTLELMLWGPSGDERGTVEVGTATNEAGPTEDESPSAFGAEPVETVSLDDWLTTCPGNAEDADTCTELSADGHHLGRTTSTTWGDLTVRDVTLRGARDSFVYAATANSLDDKWGEGSSVSAAEPPLTVDELRTIVGSDTWAEWKPGD